MTLPLACLRCTDASVVPMARSVLHDARVEGLQLPNKPFPEKETLVNAGDEARSVYDSTDAYEEAQSRFGDMATAVEEVFAEAASVFDHKPDDEAMAGVNTSSSITEYADAAGIEEAERFINEEDALFGDVTDGEEDHPRRKQHHRVTDEEDALFWDEEDDALANLTDGEEDHPRRNRPHRVTDEDFNVLEEDEIDVMSFHQNLGIRFLPDNGKEVVTALSNLSAQGLHMRYTLEEIEKESTTPWRHYWNSEACVKKRKVQKESPYFLFCHGHAPMIWTPKHKLAYMKTPKVASTAFWYFFRTHFPDSEEILPENLPKDVYVFTFVRDVFEQKLAGFAEVDLKQLSGAETKLDRFTTFQHVLPKVRNNRARFNAFLQDIWLQRFHPEDGRKPGHAGSQIGGALCSHKLDYIGHLEHLTGDWDRIQAHANLPMHLRTKALPIVHADTSENRPSYRRDESIVLTKKLKLRICKIYRSEFACLGYKAPSICSKFGVPLS